MLVGEIRDKETAKVSVEAALTGHLVFTTLHTNDAPGAITRLSEMDVDPYLVASATIGIVAQRLVRRFVPTVVKNMHRSASSWNTSAFWIRARKKLPKRR